MVKKAIVSREGQELLIPKEANDEVPIEMSYNKAKQLMKQLKPKREMSEKQKEHVQKLVESNRKKAEEQRKAKEDLKRQEEEVKRKTSTKIIVQPKRTYPPRKPKNPVEIQVEEDDDIEEVEEEEEEEEVVPIVKKKPVKPKKKKVVDSDSDDDDVIQKTKKASKLLETVSKLDEQINKMKSNSRYDSLLASKKF